MNVSYVGWRNALRLIAPYATNGMTMAEAGRNIINWGSRPADAAALTQSMTSTRAQEILGQITPKDVNNIRNFYLDTASYLERTNPTALANTPTPIVRAELMQQILKKGGH